VVTVENQNIVGGLGGAVCEALGERCPTAIRRLGVPDQFGEVADEEFLMKKHGFTVDDIVAAASDATKN
jgi:transketolase